jgi:hypothetical protein
MPYVVSASIPGAAMVVEVEVGEQEGAQPFDVVSVPRAPDRDGVRREPVGVTRDVALEELRARGGAVGGIECGAVDEASVAIDLAHHQRLDLRGGAGFAGRPQNVLQCEAIARGREQRTHRVPSILQDEVVPSQRLAEIRGHAEQAPPIIEPIGRGVQPTDGITIVGRHGTAPTVPGARHRVWRDSQRIGAELLEPCLGFV